MGFAAVTGTVTDTKGAPVVGATVTFTDETNANNKFSGSTDDQGKYTINISGATGIDASVPSAFSLGQNYPNPFNPTTTIPFTLDSSGHISVAIYNIVGQRVATVIANYMSAGTHFVTWNGMDDRGNHVSAGIYLYQLRAGRHAETKKMLLLDGGSASYVEKPSMNSGTQSVAKVAAETTYTVTITHSGIIPYEKTGITITDGQTMDFVVTLTGGPPEVNWPANVLAATTLNSPVLAALASKYGQTSMATLDSLSTADLEQAVRASFAVGIDLSAMTDTSTAANPVIQMALRIGVPIVCENNAALTAYLSSLLGLPGGSSTADIEAAAAAMTAAIGLGVQSQIAVVMPSTVSADLIGVTEIFSLGAGSEQPVLPTGTLDVGTGSLAVITDINKLLLPSKGAPLVTGPAELLTMIESAISQWLSQRSVARVSAEQVPKMAVMAAATKPAAVTQKEFLIKYSEYVWYPRDRGQDFIIQCSIRAQLFKGSGGTKKWLRLIVDDSDNTAGFLNRGDLVFTDNHDKGYFIGGAQVKLSTTADWVTFGGRNPGHVHAGIAPDGPNDSYLSDYNPAPATSVTSFGVDYVESEVQKTWNSEETRQFQMDEFELNPESGADWRWSLYLCETPDHHDHYVSKIRKLGYKSSKNEGEYYSWEYMAEQVGDGHDTINNEHTETVGWPMKMSRGTDQIGLHPKVQAYYSVPANETRSAKFTMNMSQEVWNVWSTESDNKFRASYSSGVNRNFTVDFNKMSASTAIWATGTWGNPGATRTLQADGNLVIKSKDGTKVLWASNTGGNTGAFCLKMQSDGNLVIYKRSALWSSGTSNNPGAYKKMQSDGNLVIYSKDGTKALWASGTNNNPGATLTMQDDGNLVIISKDGTKVLWAAGTGGNPGAYDVMQDDGNYVIYKDGNALWSSGTDGNPGAYDVMQSDGNYVIYTKD